MELWLLVIIALVLIPTVRLFMADGCKPAPKPPGTDPLTVEVTASGSNPSGPDASVSILGGEVTLYPPSRDSFGTPVPPGGLGYPDNEFPNRGEWFENAESPYGWEAKCTIEYECTAGPLNLQGHGTLSEDHSWNWDANDRGSVRFVLHIVDRVTGTTVGVHDWAWELSASSVPP